MITPIGEWITRWNSYKEYKKGLPPTRIFVPYPKCSTCDTNLYVINHGEESYGGNIFECGSCQTSWSQTW
jgi:hypothetical protein